MFVKKAVYRPPESFRDDELRAYRALRNGDYKVYACFDREREVLSYYAYGDPHKVACPVLVARLTAEGRLDPTADASTGYAPLLCYIEQLEANVDENGLRELYGADYDYLYRLSTMDSDEIGRHRDVRDAFLTLVSEFDRGKEKAALVQKSPAKPASNCSFLISFDIFGGMNAIRVGLRVARDGKVSDLGKGKPYFKAYLTGKDYTYRKVTYPTDKASFLPPYDEVIDFLAKATVAFSDTSSFYLESNEAVITGEDLAEVLFLLKGEKVNLFDKFTGVPEPLEGNVSISSDGELLLDPSPRQDFDWLYHSKEKIVIVDETGKLSLIKFPKEEAASIYLFFLEQGVEAYHDIVDLFPKKVLPHLGKDLLSMDSTNLEKGLTIDLYISLEDNYGISFETKYYLGGQPIDAIEFEKNPYGSGLRTAYLTSVKQVAATENGTITDSNAAYFLTADLTPLKALANLHVDERLLNLRVRKTAGVDIEAKYKNDWLELSLHSDEYDLEELKQILLAYKRKKKYVIFGGKALIIDEEEVGQVHKALRELGFDDDLEPVSGPISLAYSLPTICGDKIRIEHDEKLEEALMDIANYKNREIDLPERLENVMRPYQIEAVKWLDALEQYHLCGILADDMGLGKTIETLAYISRINSELPILIVSPKSLVYNWAAEIKKWTPEIPYEIIMGTRETRAASIRSIGTRKKKRIYLISYDSFRIDEEQFKGRKFSLAVLDEAQFIKNSITKKAKAVKGIDAERRIALTGTPIENSLKDLWSIFDFLMPNYLGEQADFVKRFSEDDPTASRRLELMVKPFLLRRKKEEVLPFLPPKTSMDIPVNMDDEERTLYESYLCRARDELDLENVTSVNILASLTRLRQICVDASSFLEDFRGESSKLSLAEMMIETATTNEHKVLVFSSFVKVLDHLRFILEGKGIRSYSITGDTPGQLRVEMADRFNRQDEVRVMLISLKAGGTGLNLHGADTVIHLDPWWNLAAENQATDRAHRIGQERPVTVYRLIAHDSVEQKVVELQEQKRGLVERFVKSGDEGVSSLSFEDVKFILS